MERDEFLKTHRFDAGTDTWMLMEGAEIKGERDEFLRSNRWDGATQAWVEAGSKKK